MRFYHPLIGQYIILYLEILHRSFEFNGICKINVKPKFQLGTFVSETRKFFIILVVRFPNIDK